MMIFIRGEMPKCKNCKGPLGWWPTDAYGEYECQTCLSDRTSNAIIEEIRKQFLNSPVKQGEVN